MKTAGQAAYERFWEINGCKDFQPWNELLPSQKERWEGIAQAARDWQPPVEKTLADVARHGFYVDGIGKTELQKWQAAGEACARIGAARERAWWRTWIGEHLGECDDAEQMLAVLADHGKEQQP